MSQPPLPKKPSALPPIPPVLMSRPRRVRLRRWSSGLGLWFMRLFILPHTIVGIGMLGSVIGFPIWMYFGVDHTAQVTETRHYTTTGKHGEVDHYDLTYTYLLNGSPHTRTTSVKFSEFDRVGGRSIAPLEKPTYGTVTVRSLGPRPPLYYEAVLEPGESGWGKLIPLTFFALFWNGVLSVFLWTAYAAPWKMRRLYRNGRIGFGVITRKYTKSNKGTNYYIEYDFFTEDGLSGHGKMIVGNSEQYANANEHDNVIVLHNDGKTAPSVLYEYGNYRCVE